VSRSKGLRVIAKASSFQFRGPDKNVKRIVAELGATHMLDGSVRRVGNQVRINAELVDTASQLTLWHERFDRSLSDIFAVQDEIAGAIADALDAHFQPARPATAINPAAYDLYLQARAIYGQDSTNADRMRCVRLLEQTVALAPDFAMAWGQLALFHGLSLPKTSDEEGAALRPVALSEAERALALDPECGPAFTARALLKPAFAEYGEKLRLAGQGYALARTEPAVAHLYAGLLMAVGRNREACEVFDAVVECDPSSPYSLAVRAYFYNAAGETVRSIKMAKELLAQFPASDYARYMLDRIVRSSAADMVVDASEAGAARARLEKRFAELHPVVDLAVIGKAARLGFIDLAYEKLFAAIAEKRPIAFDVSPDGRGFARANVAVGLFVHPMRALRQDPRFARACVELGLYDYWQSNGCQPDCARELAADYDFMAACEAAARAAGRRPLAFEKA
jgi:adenylate cyclase